MNKFDFFWLQEWYYCHRNKNYKNDEKITIFTIDNPGWRLTVNLEGTELKNKNFAEIHFQSIQEDDWIFCYIRNNKFEGACGPQNFPYVLDFFKKWAEDFANNKDIEKNTTLESLKVIRKDDFSWLQEWYFQHCDGDWEHCFGIRITTLNDQGWNFSFALNETELENKFFSGIILKGTEQNDRVECYVKQNKFEGMCGPKNLSQVLKIFREWAEA